MQNLLDLGKIWANLGKSD